MQKPNIQANHEELDLKQKDFFGTSEKAEAIKSLITSYYSEQTTVENKMLVLYGEWGSGKTSVIRYLSNELAQGPFKTIYFPAWEYEKDPNIALSLLDVITSKIEEKEKAKEIILEALSTGYALLKGFAKSITFSTPVVSINPEKVLAEYEQFRVQKELEKSFFHKNKKDFEKKFLKVEDAIIDKQTNDKIIVFVDDLDRCEPENVLNLLTAIKHFLCLGEKTIFFCALDKQAVEAAVKCKYGDYINPVDYLEKVFDISFSMPQTNVEKMVGKYFNNINQGYAEKITTFLKSIEYTNPRNVKKLLNKYAITTALIQSDGKYKDMFEVTDENCYNHIFLLFFIIIKEHYEKEEHTFLDIERKIGNYSNYLRKSLNGAPYHSSLIGALFQIKKPKEIILSQKDIQPLLLFIFMPNLDVITPLDDSITGNEPLEPNLLQLILIKIEGSVKKSIFMLLSKYLYTEITSRYIEMGDKQCVDMQAHFEIYKNIL